MHQLIEIELTNPIESDSDAYCGTLDFKNGDLFDIELVNLMLSDPDVYSNTLDFRNDYLFDFRKFTLSEFRNTNRFDVNNVNSCVNGTTILNLLYQLHIGCDKEDEDIASQSNRLCLEKYIITLLTHPDIDFTIASNAMILTAVIVDLYGDVVLIKNETLDKLFAYHKLDPNIVIQWDLICRVLKLIDWARRRFKIISDRIEMLIKYGADVNFNANSTNVTEQPYYISKDSRRIFDIIVLHTTHFYHLGHVARYALSGNITVRSKILDNILKDGKIWSFQYLDKDSYKKIQAFEKWISNIKKYNLNIREARECFSLPIKHFDITMHIGENRVIKKICIFRQNLECLTLKPITTPAYKFYHIAIFILFLMRNQHLTALTCDVLRHIATLVFS